jgi:hypothetical protein
MSEFFGKKEYKRAATGTTQAVCCDVEFLKDQTVEYDEKSYTTNQFIFSFEIPEVNPDRGTRFVVRRKYNESFGERAHLPRVLAALLGHTITKEEVDKWRVAGFEAFRTMCIGKNVLLNLVDSKSGEYTNIETVSPPLTGMNQLVIQDYKPKSDEPIPF